MYCVKSRQSIEEIIKKSRFIGVVLPCASENDALLELKRLHEQHPNANHIAFAYRIKTEQGLRCRFYDAGEPSGTAGKPIFQHLEGKQLINLLLVVVRYFGGVKLGAGGLTRAYGNTAKAVIEAAKVVDYIELATVELTLDYNQMQTLEYQLKKLNGILINQDFSEQVRVGVQLPAEHVDKLLNQFSGNY